MKSILNKKKNQPTEHVIMKVSIVRRRHGGPLVTIQMPAWLIMAGAFLLLLAVVAIIVSPEIAAKLAFALIQLARLVSQSAK